MTDVVDPFTEEFLISVLRKRCRVMTNTTSSNGRVQIRIMVGDCDDRGMFTCWATTEIELSAPLPPPDYNRPPPLTVVARNHP